MNCPNLKIFFFKFFFFNSIFSLIEDDFTGQNLFRCRNSTKKITVEQVCNSIINCPLGDDELHCFENEPYFKEHCNLYSGIKLVCLGK